MRQSPGGEPEGEDSGQVVLDEIVDRLVAISEDTRSDALQLAALDGFVEGLAIGQVSGRVEQCR